MNIFKIVVDIFLTFYTVLKTAFGVSHFLQILITYILLWVKSITVYEGGKSRSTILQMNKQQHK